MTSKADYYAYKTKETLVIDGNLNKELWKKAPKSTRFVDMATASPGFYDTRMACTWNDSYFYVGFWIEEPYLEAHHTERDAIIFQENDIELFIDGGDCYYELELNALGTVYEVMFIWKDAYHRSGRFDVPEFNLLDKKVYSFAGDFDRQPESFWKGTHPRGARWAFLDWDFPGLEIGIQLQGSLNDHSDIDKGWTVEIALPWSGMTWLNNGRSLPPKDGDSWGMFFGRFQKLMNAGQEISPHPAWVLKPHGKYDTHQPEKFPRVCFLEQDIYER